MKDEKSRGDFGMAEALAFGTLALHRGVRPKEAHPAFRPAAAGSSATRYTLTPTTISSHICSVHSKKP